MSSDIPFARRVLVMALKEGVMDPYTRRCIKKALSRMTRAKAVRRASVRHVEISESQKAAVRKLLRTDVTMHEIANLVGIANGGRISEIATRKR